MSDDGEYHGQHTVRFTQTTWVDRLKEFAPYLPKEIPIFGAVTISIWGVAEVLSEVGGEALSLKNLAGPALITASVVAIYKAVKKYRDYVPESLASESKISRSIFRKGVCGWQFAMALQMLSERTDNFDRMLGRIESGAYFAQPQHFDTAEYMKWLARRPEVLSRLLRAVALQCVSELPSILATTRDESSFPELKDSVDQLSMLYKETVDFELASRSTHPPDELADVHEMIFGWSRPIRAGIQEFMEVLRAISVIDAKDVKRGTVTPPSFQIKFEAPPNIDEFVRRLQLSELNTVGS